MDTIFKFTSCSDYGRYRRGPSAYLRTSVRIDSAERGVRSCR